MFFKVLAWNVMCWERGAGPPSLPSVGQIANFIKRNASGLVCHVLGKGSGNPITSICGSKLWTFHVTPSFKV